MFHTLWCLAAQRKGMVIKMNYHMQELLRILRDSRYRDQTTYAGRAVYIYLDQELRAKLEFASDALSCHLDAIQATVFNRVDGKVDTIRFLFSDLLGVKKTNHPSFPQGIVPHLLEDGNKLEWHVYQPSAADYRIIAESLDEYLQVFQSQQANMSQKMY